MTLVHLLVRLKKARSGFR